MLVVAVALPDPTSAPVHGSDATVFGDPPSEHATVLRAGLEIAGRYRLVAPLGKGGMGEVWEAQHMVIGRMVAIKMLLRQGAGAGGPGDEAAMRLQREAEIIARLEHPNIVGVIDFGHAAPGQPFVVMERLSGRPLSSVLKEHGALPWAQARDIAAQVAAGLACAHEVGVVHRDLKPSNVFVQDDASGRLAIKLIDFGLAKLTELAPGDRALTRSGAVFGTPAYMAPEQARGEPLDGRVDLYALGAMLYEMIVGEPLWRRSTVAQLLYCHLFEPAPTIRARVPEVPPELDALVARCLCKDRAMRPDDTEAVRRELLAAGTGRGRTLAPHEVIPAPDPELRARYATGGADVEPAARSAAASRLWLVPVVLGVTVTIAVVLGVRLWPRGEAVADPIREAAPIREATPIPAEPATPASIPASIPASPAVPTIDATVASPSAAPKDATPPTVIPVAGDTSTPRPAARVRPKPRSGDGKPRKAAPKPGPNVEPTPEPVAPTPAKAEPSPAPKRKGELFDWPTP